MSAMKYLVMVQGTQADYEAATGAAAPDNPSPAWSEQDLSAMYAYMGAINEELQASGEFVDGQGLAEPARTWSVTADAQGSPVVTEDPYGKTEVVLAGYWVLDCPSLDRVTEIAARVSRCPVPPGSPEHPVLIRPLDGAEG
jgi:hypothetical protein